MKLKIGLGYDVHKLVEGKDFWLGGIKIDHTKGAIGHSDADVLLHSICDALLGAANLRDIGFHFPDTSSTYKGIDSKILLADVVKLIEDKGYQISNVDCTIALQEPKISPYIEEMKSTISKIMKLDVDDVSVKATTTERLGFEGREEGVSAQVVTLLYKN